MGIGPWVGGHCVSIREPPAVRGEKAEYFRRDICHSEGQLQRLGDPLWQVDKFQEFTILAPVVDLALEFDMPVLLPVADGGELFLLRGAGFPEIEEDGLPHVALKPWQRRNATPWSTNIFTIGYKVLMLSYHR